MRRMLLCLTGVLVLAACGDNTAQSPHTVDAPAVTSAAGAVPESLAFSAPRVGGGTIDMSQYAGKPLLVWFWAPT